MHSNERDPNPADADREPLPQAAVFSESRRAAEACAGKHKTWSERETGEYRIESPPPLPRCESEMREYEERDEEGEKNR